MADLDEAGWQDMKQEPPDELDGIERHQLLLIVIGRVSPAESRLAIAHLDQTPVGDGDTMRIARQIFEDVFGSTEWTPGLNDPLQMAQVTKEAVESLRPFERSELA